jgi:hypothetical protein
MELLLAGAGILGVMALREDIAKSIKTPAHLQGERDYGHETDPFPDNIGSDASVRLGNESGQRNFPVSRAEHLPVVREDVVSAFNEPFMSTVDDPGWISAYAANYSRSMENVQHRLLDINFRSNPYNMYRQRACFIGSADDQNILGSLLG